MFTPENFYYVIRENYAYPHDSIMWVPQVNGAKDIDRFITYFEHVDDSRKYIYSGIGNRAQQNYIFMYDQEPVYPHIIDRYRINRQDQEEVKLHNIIKQTPWTDLLSSGNGCGVGVPIWCHSELNSSEIAELESSLFISCYYWYHAFISRDWFRHYQYNMSLQPCDKSNYPYRFLLYARAKDGTRLYRQQMIENLLPHKSKILYNWNETNIVGPEHSAKIDRDDALSSGIHLVAETLFDTTKVYVTEKVFKPMVMSQPFIIWGAPGTLAYLRRYGFRTFDNIWSEEYDTETDHAKRMSMLIKLVDDLSSMSFDEFSDVFRRCLPIIEHNRKWFFSQKFMDQCWKELHDNFNKSFERRQDLLLDNPGGQIFYVLKRNPRLLELSNYKAMIQQILLALDSERREKILKSVGFLNQISF